MNRFIRESSIDKGLALAHDECKLENTELGTWLVKPCMKNQVTYYWIRTNDFRRMKAIL